MGWRRRLLQGGQVSAMRWPRGVGLTAMLLLALTGPALAQDDSSNATTNKEARQDAIASIPVRDLPKQDVQRIASIVNNATLYRRLPTRTIDCDPNLFLFLARHPDVIVGIWDLMDISNVSLQRTGEKTFQASDHKGTLCKVELLHSSKSQQIYLAEGKYDGPLFQNPVIANCIVILRSIYGRDEQGRILVKAQVDTFIDFDRAGLKLIALTVQPLIGKAADYNFTETMTFVSRLSQVAEENQPGILRMAQKLDQLDPDVRSEFVEVSEKVAQRTKDGPKVREVRLETPQSETALDAESRWRR